MIYFIQAEGIGHIKIGFTGDDDASSRLAAREATLHRYLRSLDHA